MIVVGRGCVPLAVEAVEFTAFEVERGILGMPRNLLSQLRNAVAEVLVGRHPCREHQAEGGPHHTHSSRQ